MPTPYSPLTAGLAVRIAAEMVCQIVNGLRPRDSDPLRFQRVVVLIGRAAQVDLPEVREADAANERFMAAEESADAQSPSQETLQQPSAEGA